MPNRNPFRLRATAAAVSAALASGAQAQEGVLEIVVVTATKREENLTDIPLNITALPTDEIDKAGYDDIDDYVNRVPSLAFARREPSGGSVVFRGVASSGIQFLRNPSSGVYLDEQPITSAGINPDPRLIDIQRIEALSGPQGTLFGDASQSGTLRIITNKPDPLEFDAWVEGDVSKVKDGELGYDVSAMANIPLVQDKLALRLVGFTSEEAGYIDRVLGDSPGGTFNSAAFVEEDVNTTNFSGGRAALRWTPDDRWTVDASAIFQSSDGDGFSDTDFGRQEDLQQVRFNEERFDDDWYQTALTLEGSFDFGDLLFSVSYFDREVKYDADSTTYQFAFQQIGDEMDRYYYTIYDFGGDPRGFATDVVENDRLTVEARWTTSPDSDSRWKALVGFFYNESDLSSVFSADVDQLPGSPAFYYLAYNTYAPSLNGLGLVPGEFAPTNNWFYGIYDQQIDQMALFGEVSVDITEDFTITVGGRWYDIDREDSLILGALQQGAAPNVNTDRITTNDDGSASDDGFVPKLNLAWRFNENSLAYATYSEGFRTGGPNALRPNSVLPRSYDADEVQNVELGIKTTVADGRLFLEATVYRMTWDDIQIQVNDPQPSVFQLGVVNFPEAEIDGFEAGFAFSANDNVSIFGNVAYNDAEISETLTLFPGTGEELTALDGTRLPITPDWKWTLIFENTFDYQWNDASPYLRLEYAHVGDSINALQGLEAIVGAPPPTEQEAYQVLGLQAGLEADMWSATFYINNLTDERGDRFINNRWAQRRVSVTPPRTLGLTFRRRF